MQKKMPNFNLLYSVVRPDASFGLKAKVSLFAVTTKLVVIWQETQCLVPANPVVHEQANIVVKGRMGAHISPANVIFDLLECLAERSLRMV